MRQQKDFVWGPWAGMGKFPVPINIRRRRRIKLALWAAAILFMIGCGLAGLHWNGPQL